MIPRLEPGRIAAKLSDTLNFTAVRREQNVDVYSFGAGLRLEFNWSITERLIPPTPPTPPPLPVVKAPKRPAVDPVNVLVPVNAAREDPRRTTAAERFPGRELPAADKSVPGANVPDLHLHLRVEGQAGLCALATVSSNLLASARRNRGRQDERNRQLRSHRLHAEPDRELPRQCDQRDRPGRSHRRLRAEDHAATDRSAHRRECARSCAGARSAASAEDDEGGADACALPVAMPMEPPPPGDRFPWRRI